MSQNRSKSTAAFLLSLIIHGSLGAGIVYLGLDMVLPEGTVSSTEIDYVGGPISKGNQTVDVSQSQNTVAKRAKPKAVKKAPPPPPPPEIDDGDGQEVLTADSEEDIFAVDKPEKKKKAKTLKKALAQPQEKETDALDKYFDEKSKEDIDSELYAKNSQENEALQNDAEDMEDVEFPEAEEEVQGNAYQDEQAYGISQGAQSHKNLVEVPGNVPPKYPMMSRLRKQQGHVIIEFEVNSSGFVVSPRVAQSSGYPALDESALDAHTKWRYRAGKAGKFIKKYSFILEGPAQEYPKGLRRQGKPKQ